MLSVLLGIQGLIHNAVMKPGTEDVISYSAATRTEIPLTNVLHTSLLFFFLPPHFHTIIKHYRRLLLICDPRDDISLSNRLRIESLVT